MMLNSHDSYLNFLMTNFNIMYYSGDRGINPLIWEDKLIPFEREFYVRMLLDKAEEAHKKNHADPLLGEPTQEEYE